MSTYLEQIKAYLSQTDLPDGKSVIDILYFCNLENQPGDGEAIRREFDKLHAVLDKLTLTEYDRVWDAACRLCDGHEHRGFAAGLRMGVGLMLELSPAARGKGRF